MASFIWFSGADTNGANNWTTPADWRVGGLPPATFPNSAADTATVNSDPGAGDAIISGGQAITIGSLSIGDSGVAGVPGGHVLVGGSTAIGGGGGGSLTSVGPITVSSTNSGGGLVGGLGAVINAPSLTLSGPGVVVGGGGIFNVPNIVNNGEIQADGGTFNLGGLLINSTTISGTGFIEVDGPSSVQLNAATAEPVRVAASRGETATVIFDQPAAFTGSLNVLNANTTVDLFFKGQAPTGATFNPDAHALVITGAGGAALDTIPFASDGTVALAVVPSTIAGYGEITLTPTTPTVIPQIPPPVGGISTTTLSSADLSALLQSDQSAIRFVAGTEAIVLVDGVLSVGPDTNEAFIARLYEGLLGRGPDENGLSFWDASLAGGATRATVAQSLLSSAEFQTAHPGLDDATFVGVLYQGMLGRGADSGGLGVWTQALAGGMSRGDVAAAFADSAEAKQHWSGVTSAGIFAHDLSSAIVREDYQTAFGRDADTGGLASWTGFLHSGGTAEQLAQSFALSPEFQALHGQQTDLLYVDSLYANGLGRAADPGGEAFWAGALQTGTSRGDVLAAIAQSSEGQQHLQWPLVA